MRLDSLIPWLEQWKTGALAKGRRGCESTVLPRPRVRVPAVCLSSVFLGMVAVSWGSRAKTVYAGSGPTRLYYDSSVHQTDVAGAISYTVISQAVQSVAERNYVLNAIVLGMRPYFELDRKLASGGDEQPLKAFPSVEALSKFPTSTPPAYSPRFECASPPSAFLRSDGKELGSLLMHVLAAADRAPDLACFVFRKGEEDLEGLLAIVAEELIPRHGPPPIEKDRLTV